MEETLPATCQVTFDDPSCLHQFSLIVTPDSGFWQGGRFSFSVFVPDEYNIVVGLHKILYDSHYL